MKRSHLILLAGAVLVVAIAAIAGGFLLLRTPQEEEPDPGPVIARVGGTPIYLGQARTRLAGVSSVHEDVKTTLGDDWPDKILRSLADDVVIQRAATDAGVRITDAELGAAFEEMRAKFATEDEFARWLSSNGMTAAALEQRIHLQMLSSEMYLHVTDGVEATRQQIREYYRDHQTDFAASGRVTPLLEVRNDIRDIVDKAEKDRAFAEWLDQQRTEWELVVVMDGWWERL